MATKKAADMPTLSLLYKTKHLKAPPPGTRLPLTPTNTQTTLPAPSKALNDRVALYSGDITRLELDAIVNAANQSLLGGGGVDGAIHRTAGRALVEECRTLDGCATGSAKITDAYNLPCKKVIHAVGPRYSRSRREESELALNGCYETSMRLAVESGCRTVAFSGISTGIYGFPHEDATAVALSAVRKALLLSDSEEKKIDLVVFTVFTDKDRETYHKMIPLFFPPVPEASSGGSGSGFSKQVDGAQDEEDAEDVEAEQLKQALPDVPKTDPDVVDAEAGGSSHVDKKPRVDA